MKKFQLLGVLAIALMLSICVVSHALAKDMIITATVDSVTTKIDSRGNEYTRVIVQESRELSGVGYKTTLPLMAFGPELSAVVKDLKQGDTIKAIVKHKPASANYGESYVLIRQVP